MTQNLNIKCHYCTALALGINYRPRPQLQNAPACISHQTSLFIPYKQQAIKEDIENIQQSIDEVRQLTQVRNKDKQLKNQQFFSDLMNTILGQFNLFKSQVNNCQEKIKKLEKSQTYEFELPNNITNPYMILKEDKQMMLNTFLARIKNKFDQKNGKIPKKGIDNKVQWSSIKKQRQSTPLNTSNLKYSMITDVSNNYRASFNSSLTTPSNFKEQIRFFRKSEVPDI